jgi:hypothetical protein
MKTDKRRIFTCSLTVSPEIREAAGFLDGAAFGWPFAPWLGLSEVRSLSSDEDDLGWDSSSLLFRGALRSCPLELSVLDREPFAFFSRWEMALPSDRDVFLSLSSSGVSCRVKMALPTSPRTFFFFSLCPVNLWSYDYSY